MLNLERKKSLKTAFYHTPTPSHIINNYFFAYYDQSFKILQKLLYCLINKLSSLFESKFLTPKNKGVELRKGQKIS